MTNRCGHFTDLAIFSFGQLKSDPAVGNAFANADGGITGWKLGLGIQKPSTAGEGLMLADRYPLGEPFQGC